MYMWIVYPIFISVIVLTGIVFIYGGLDVIRVAMIKRSYFAVHLLLCFLLIFPVLTECLAAFIWHINIRHHILSGLCSTIWAGLLPISVGYALARKFEIRKPPTTNYLGILLCSVNTAFILYGTLCFILSYIYTELYGFWWHIPGYCAVGWGALFPYLYPLAFVVLLGITIGGIYCGIALLFIFVGLSFTTTVLMLSRKWCQTMILSFVIGVLTLPLGVIALIVCGLNYCCAKG